MAATYCELRQFQTLCVWLLAVADVDWLLEITLGHSLVHQIHRTESLQVSLSDSQRVVVLLVSHALFL